MKGSIQKEAGADSSNSLDTEREGGMENWEIVVLCCEYFLLWLRFRYSRLFHEVLTSADHSNGKWTVPV